MKEYEIITVLNENGEKVELELIDDIKIAGNEYVIAGPKESDEVCAYKSVVKNGETEYLCIGEGEEFERVLQKYMQN
ncbi:MAG TPA: DUF1292 domain-containing protein [Clostridiaceae bacterium]